MMIKNYITLSLIGSLLFFSSCGDDGLPPIENEEEVIDKVTLTFTESGSSGNTIVAEAIDPDGLGSDDFSSDPINLKPNTVYTLSIMLENTEDQENITEEIEEESDEHMFFFQFTTDVFSSPSGNGNIDARSDDLEVNYQDQDENGLPIGLSTTWTTSDNESSEGTFRVLLAHQPDGLKSATSDSSTGDPDIDILWTLNIAN